ncbi:MAG: hypothetical protein M3Z24_07910 [Chloroflexota bacterium]|nr:hypothetical protein [Chloroflexota bacterium]
MLLPAPGDTHQGYRYISADGSMKRASLESFLARYHVACPVARMIRLLNRVLQEPQVRRDHGCARSRGVMNAAATNP